MNESTLNALNGSIKHWERLSTGNRNPREDSGSEHCPLCEKFCVEGLAYCVGCPVMERTGFSHCDNSPYDEASEARLEGLDSPEFKRAARKELKFLKSLLP